MTSLQFDSSGNGPALVLDQPGPLVLPVSEMDGAPRSPRSREGAGGPLSVGEKVIPILVSKGSC